MAREAGFDAILTLMNDFENRIRVPPRSISARNLSQTSSPPTLNGIFKLMKSPTPTSEDFLFNTSQTQTRDDLSVSQDNAMSDEAIFAAMRLPPNLDDFSHSSRQQDTAAYYNEPPRLEEFTLGPPPRLPRQQESPAYYNEAPPTYDEVMNQQQSSSQSSLFGSTAYNLEENDTTALLAEDC